MKKSFIVTVNLPDGVTATEMRYYIRQAIEQWRHGGDPDEPMFGANLNVRVRAVKAEDPEVAAARKRREESFMKWLGQK